MASDEIPVTISERRIFAQTTILLTVTRDLGWRRIGFGFIRLGAWIVGSGATYEVQPLSNQPGITSVDRRSIREKQFQKGDLLHYRDVEDTEEPPDSSTITP
jgi:hypothetical protein